MGFALGADSIINRLIVNVVLGWEEKKGGISIVVILSEAVISDVI